MASQTNENTGGGWSSGLIVFDLNRKIPIHRMFACGTYSYLHAQNGPLS